LTIILATNNKELCNTVKKFYGNNFDGYNYLNKIYDAIFTLSIDNIDNYLRENCGMINQTNLPENISLLLFKFLNFSYRDCNRYISMYKIIEPYIKYKSGFGHDQYLFESSVILPMALSLKIKNIDEYTKFVNGDSDAFIKTFLNFLPNFNQQIDYTHWLCEILKIDDSNELYAEFIKKYHNTFSSDNKYNSFPYFDALSLLGNLINYK
jgi:hypothetical protein